MNVNRDILTKIADFNNTQLLKAGARPFKATAYFTRPADANIYAVDDAICNSTSSPAIMSFDLATFGAVVGQAFMVTNARMISDKKPTALDLNANIWIFNQTFAGTNDNSILDIDDATAQTGGIVIPCLNAYRNNSNHRCVSDPGQWVGFLAANNTSIYFTTQAANTYTPQNGERFDVVLEGVLL